jgi:hypothetical protein
MHGSHLKCKKPRRVLTAASILAFLAAPRRAHKPSKMRHPRQPAGTLGGPVGPPEPAEPVLAHPSVPAPQDLEQTGPRLRRRTRPPAPERLRDLAGLLSHLHPHRQRPSH